MQLKLNCLKVASQQTGDVFVWRGGSPSSLTFVFAEVAQQVVQLTCNQWVEGSIPFLGTIFMGTFVPTKQQIEHRGWPTLNYGWLAKW